MITFIQVHETFKRGNRLVKMIVDSQEEDRLVYFFDIKSLMITHTVWNFNSNRAPLFYNNEVEFFKAVKRILRKQK